jgi:hypothetical protein
LIWRGGLGDDLEQAIIFPRRLRQQQSVQRGAGRPRSPNLARHRAKLKTEKLTGEVEVSDYFPPLYHGLRNSHLPQRRGAKLAFSIERGILAAQRAIIS